MMVAGRSRRSAAGDAHIDQLTICRRMRRSMAPASPGFRPSPRRIPYLAALSRAVESLPTMCSAYKTLSATWIIAICTGSHATVVQYSRDGFVEITDAVSETIRQNRDAVLSVTSSGRQQYRALSEAVALRHAGADAVAAVGLDAVGFATLFTALIDQESRFDPAAVSPKGAEGLGQLMPATARELGVADPFDPEANLDGAARYLVRQLAAFGDVRLALAAYNAGPHRVIQYGGVPPFDETRAYVAAISEAAGLDAAAAPQPALGSVPARAIPAIPLRTDAAVGAHERNPSVWQF